MSSLLQRNTIIKQSLFLFFVTCFLGLAQLQTTGIYTYHLLYVSASVVFFALFGPNKLNTPTLLILLSLVGIFFYSLLFSVFPARSLTSAMGLIASALVLLAIWRTVFDTSLVANDFTTRSLYLATGIAFAPHILLSILQNLTLNQRSLGFMQDYGQSSFFVVLLFTLLYPILRKSSNLALPTFFILALAIFAPFSRASTACCIVLILILSLIEYRSNQRVAAAKLLSAFFLAGAVIYAFPNIKNQEAVDRGGVSQFKTLNSRTTYWSAATNAISERPITGHGLETYEFTGIKQERPSRFISKPHNDYIQVVHDLGLPLGLLVIGIWLFFITKLTPWISIKRIVQGDQESVDEDVRNLVSWLALPMSATYMTINFLVTSVLFQILIGLIFLECLKNVKK